MYDIRQFRPAMYALVLLGISGYALASQSPGLWVLSVGAILFNAWLVHTDRFRPMPRWLANGLTVLALLYAALRLRALAAPPILVIGEFLVVLQIVKLFEQRANRDYAQLLVLSLLLMVAASISTSSLLFGIMLIAYLFLSLYCCLLFHLKVETDYARRAMNLSDDPAHTGSLRQDQRFLPRSMRRLTGAIAVVSVSMAVIVFILFPRGPGQGLFGSQLQFRPSQSLTGFSGEVSLNSISRIQQNPAVVARVKVWLDEKPFTGGSIYLRGSTVDVYDDRPGAWNWSRSTRDDESPIPLRGGEMLLFGDVGGVQRWRQEIMLEPTGDDVIFTIPGAMQITPGRDLKVRYSTHDQTVAAGENITQQLRYEVVSTNKLPAARDRYRQLAPRFGLEPPMTRFRDVMGLPPPNDTEWVRRLREIAIRPEISGVDAEGRSLGEQRLRRGDVTEFDAAIAENIVRYFHENFRYTLDLSGEQRDPGLDPILWFLDLKRGHCEYFASAMTRMCQSLGIQARMVTGFRCDNYNAAGGYFLVQQLHAHAWVEVLTPDGWLTFDPTTGRTDEAGQRQTGAWARVKHFFDFLEYTWANSVVAYDQESRTNLLQNVDTTLTTTAINSTLRAREVRSWFNDAANFYFVSSGLLSVLIGLAVLAMLVAVGWFLIERWRLRRRARRIGIESLPTSQQKRLARQLAFYDELLRLLERRGIRRKPHQTPLEFSTSISYLPAEAFDAIRRLTRIFYRVRYGQAELSPARRRWLENVIERLGRTIDRRTTGS
jgi:transglutaminase-like putative cysteine protease